MSYSDKLKESKNKVYRAAIATKILDLMEKLRMGASDASERRWIWELLQNAKDVCYDETGISVIVNYDSSGSVLEFSHNGKPFAVDNITFLIEQVSTKERQTAAGGKPKTTGKFGTGFLTTHLLSEIVEVTGILEEPGETPRHFSIQLDRSGRELDDISTSVERSLAALDHIDDLPIASDSKKENFNTIFRYKLNDKGKKAVEIGLKDLHNAVAFTLAFVPQVRMISIPHESVIYRLMKADTIADDIRIVHVIRHEHGTYANIYFACLHGERASIAIGIEKKDNNIFVKNLDKSVTRLFCDFPLIGSEDFYFPVIVNSSFFNPTEPRDSIFLSEIAEQKILDNKEIMLEAAGLYLKLIEHAANNGWKDLFNLVDIRKAGNRDWISQKWYNEEILAPIRKKILNLPIVETENGEMCSMLDAEGKYNIYFPSHSKTEVRERIWDLEYPMFPDKLPAKKDIHAWYRVVWDDCFMDTLEAVTEYIHEKGNVENLSSSLEKDESAAYDWLNQYYDLLNFEDAFITEIINEKYAVIPNQNGKFLKKTDLLIDDDIEEELKNVLDILGLDIREKLLNINIDTASRYTEDTARAILYYEEKQSDVINKINKRLEDNLQINVDSAASHLLSLISEDSNFPAKRAKMYGFCKKIQKDSIPDKKTIKNWDNDIWKICEPKRLEQLVVIISETGDIYKLTELLDCKNDEDTLKWLDEFIGFVVSEDYEDLINDEFDPILPNQNGIYKIKDELFLDDGEIDEELKNIAASLGYDIRDELLDKRIFLKLPENRVLNQEAVADEISKLVKPLFAEFPRSPETRQIFKTLYLWFSENRETAQNIFSDLYKNKHKLYDDDEIAENMKKAEDLDDLLNSTGMSIEEIKKALEGKISPAPTVKTEPATPNIQLDLIVLGIYDKSDLDRLLVDGIMSESFKHISGASQEMFEFVQNLIKRAIDNVKKHLLTLPEYDLSGWEPISTTVIGGIKKEGIPISLVIRPSDGGQVIFYYGPEKETLEHPRSELWVEDGKAQPQHLTLGRVLKTNRLDRIKV